jgi:pSer/pThr/pTyr-binding forkhead associated (FHA) protein
VSDAVLTILKFCLMALVYLFLLRVVLVVGAELRGSPAIVSAGSAPPAESRRGRRTFTVAIVQPPERAQAWEVAGELTIGRAGGCTIALPDDTFVSQIHARVFERDGEPWVEDLGSTNGTLLNGKPLSEAQRLRRGDRVQIGSTLLEVRRS